MSPTTQQTHRKRQRLRASRSLNPHPERVSDALFQDREFFDRDDLLQVKYEMLRCVEQEGRSVAQAAADFGFSRRHFYVIQQQFAEAGFQGLVPDKRGPRGAHKLDDEVMRLVMAALNDDPTLKAPGLARLIEREFRLSIHPRTIEKALARKKNRAAN
jgi:transposase